MRHLAKRDKGSVLPKSLPDRLDVYDFMARSITYALPFASRSRLTCARAAAA